MSFSIPVHTVCEPGLHRDLRFTGEAGLSGRYVPDILSVFIHTAAGTVTYHLTRLVFLSVWALEIHPGPHASPGAFY